MTVHVHIPTRIRVDPERVTERQGCIEEALSQAVLRALRRSFQVVLEERGGPRKVACHRARIHLDWGGDGRVDATVRRSLEERVANAFSEAADKAGVPDSTHITGRPMDARPRAVEEIVDPDRYSECPGPVRGAEHDSKGERQAVEVVSFEPDERHRDHGRHGAVTDWERMPRDEDFEQALIGRVEETGREFPTAASWASSTGRRPGRPTSLFKVSFRDHARIGDPFLNEPIEGLKNFTFRMRKGQGGSSARPASSCLRAPATG